MGVGFPLVSQGLSDGAGRIKTEPKQTKKRLGPTAINSEWTLDLGSSYRYDGRRREDEQKEGGSHSTTRSRSIPEFPDIGRGCVCVCGCGLGKGRGATYIRQSIDVCVRNIFNARHPVPHFDPTSMVSLFKVIMSHSGVEAGESRRC